jgi:hypothetical protein
MDNAAGISSALSCSWPKIGQVEKLFSPISKEDASVRSHRGGTPSPDPTPPRSAKTKLDAAAS